MLMDEEKKLSYPAGTSAEAPAALPGWKKREQSVVGVSDVLDDVFHPL